MGGGEGSAEQLNDTLERRLASFFEHAFKNGKQISYGHLLESYMQTRIYQKKVAKIADKITKPFSKIKRYIKDI